MTLNDLILSEPSLADAIASGNDGQIANWLNTPSVSVQQPIPINTFVGELYNSGAFVAILQAASTGNSTAAMAVTLIEKAKTLGIERIDLGMPVNQSMIATLISEGIITQAQADSAMDLANAIVSPAKANGFNQVSIEQIAKALRG